MSTPEIQSVLSQMRQLAADAGGVSRSGSIDGRGGFSGELRASLERINGLQQAAGEQARAFQAGDPSVSLPQVMVDSQKASVAFEMGVQTRNRLVSAYKEIMNMQV
ncbi:flagellar hook-basal body complex protein [Alcanivorax balearicus MACL04]|uniref:Flagellar hook-basal body complex protein FliE n=1 Tax=Alloalcanivorax balearicus MACL04 TaxID=1177182 RepID=A0ABT2R381_9GAMM|nr:flagellar hook-basal body complex protein FliE [Alloalcanivorax balearicus]MCU5784248.1 flagellar hook-basal body complex protein [Alloalcanivorax balearicus MACL04]